MPAEDEGIMKDYTMPPELVEKLESLTGRKYTYDEKRRRVRNSPLSPETVQKLEDLRAGVK
jgi:hypothetical protein